jgi:hypothetical protein
LIIRLKGCIFDAWGVSPLMLAVDPPDASVIVFTLMLLTWETPL